MNWLVVREDSSLHQAGVMDLALADLPTVFPSVPKTQTFSHTKELKIIDLQNFQPDVGSFVVTTQDKRCHLSAAQQWPWQHPGSTRLPHPPHPPVASLTSPLFHG